MSGDLVIRGGRVVTPSGVVEADVRVADGVITEVGPSLGGGETLDATGRLVLPGVIDAHVHFNEPGRADWEGVGTGSDALAAGGGTLFFDMPLNSVPAVLDRASFEAKAAVMRASSRTDFALWGGLTPLNLDRLEELRACGVIGLKAFMSGSGVDEFPRADDATLLAGMERAASLGLLVAVHAEDEELTRERARLAVAAGRTTVRDYLDSRPAVAEWEAIQRAVLFAGETGCRLHIVHVSTARGVRLVTEARARGVDVTCETCPHYLVFSEEDVERGGALWKCAPPLRPVAEREALWDEVRSGAVTFVASDHSPSDPGLKGGPDFFRIWGGIAGVQFTLHALLAAGCGERGLAWPDAARLTAAGPAKRFCLAPRKGEIREGSDADLCLVAPDETWVATRQAQFCRHRDTAYTGRTFRGRVVRTLLRGSTIFCDGTLVGAPSGRLIVPS